MNKPIWIPTLLIVLGLVFTYLGLTATRRDAIVSVGEFKATVDRKEMNPVMTSLGVAALAGGIYLMARRPKA
jgi:hypothetical protein